MQGRGVVANLRAHYGDTKTAVGYDQLMRVLEDDRAYFPAYEAVLLYRRDLPQRLPRPSARRPLPSP